MESGDEHSEELSKNLPPHLQRNYQFYQKNKKQKRAYKHVIPCKTEWNVIQQSYKLNAMKEEKGGIKSNCVVQRSEKASERGWHP